MFRRWFPWIVIVTGHAWLIHSGGVLGDSTLAPGVPWWFVFLVLMAAALTAAAVHHPSVLIAYLSILIVVGAARSVAYLLAGATNPTGVWVLVVGTSLLVWAERYGKR